jgi:hypothetical protein
MGEFVVVLHAFCGFWVVGVSFMRPRGVNWRTFIPKFLFRRVRDSVEMFWTFRAIYIDVQKIMIAAVITASLADALRLQKPSTEPFFSAWS